MQTRYLQEYLELVGYMNFTKAANHLNITQPALSKHIAQLEMEFGASFIDRSGQRIVLTDQGRVFCAEAQRILEACKQAKQNVNRAKHSVHIGGRFEDSAINRYFNAVMSVVSQGEFAEIPVVRVMSSLPYEDLDRGFIDICIEAALSNDEFNEEIYGVQRVSAVPFCALLSKDHPLASKEKLSIADLDGETVIHPVGDQVRTRGYSLLGEICKRHNATINKRVVYTQSVLDYSDIQINRDIFIMPQPVLTKQMFPQLDKDYVSKSFIEQDIALPLQIVWRKDNTNPAVAEMAKIIIGNTEDIEEITTRSFVS